MKWKAREIIKKTEWYPVIAWLPVKTENGWKVWLEKVNKRWKVHMNGGSYVYSMIKSDVVEEKDD